MDSRRHGIRRFVTRVIVFLLLGAAFNVAVAWGCAMLPPVSLDRGKPTHDDCEWLTRTGFVPHPFTGRSYLMEKMPHDPDPDPVQVGWQNWWSGEVIIFKRPGATWRIPPSGDFILRGVNMAHAVRVCSGWPCLSLAGGAVGWPSSDWSTSELTFNGFNDLADALRAEAGTLGRVRIPSIKRPIPVHPIILGFAINTVFYAGVCWLLFAAPFAVRRYRGGRRIKRGLCPACGYLVGTSDVCTECGAVLPLPPGEGRGEGVRVMR